MISARAWHQRYSRQAAWTRSLRKFLFNRIDVDISGRILEVGCGTGAVLMDACDASSMIHGLDIDRDYLSLCKINAPSASLVQGDAYKLPYDTDSFGAVYCHFLLLWLSHPLSALIEMKRVAWPGGYVVAMAEPDYGGRIDHPADLALLGQWQAEALMRQGANPQMGRHLSGIFHQAGLENIQTGILGGEWQGMPPIEERESEWETLKADLAGAVPVNQLSQYKESEAKAWQEGSRVLYVPTFYAIGCVPEE